MRGARACARARGDWGVAGSPVDVLLQRVADDEEAREAGRAPVRAEERVVELDVAVRHEAERGARERVRRAGREDAHVQRGEERGVLCGEYGVADGDPVGRLWEMTSAVHTVRARGEEGRPTTLSR